MSLPGSESRLIYRLYCFTWTALDWLFPPRCASCEQPGDRWCVRCQHQVQVLTDRVCNRCGQPQAVGGLCGRCRASPPPMMGIRAWGVFNGTLRSALHQLKYKGDLAMGEVLARPMIQILHKLCWPIDFVVPVPSGIARQRERGYNQAALLARPLALATGLAYRPQALVKVRETRSQVGLTIRERQNNVAQAFQAQPRLVNGQRVLVVDDVTTSGATLDACGEALLAGGALEVYGLTLARADTQSNLSGKI